MQKESSETGQLNLSPARAGQILWLLVVCVGLMMTGYGIIMPIMAKRLGEIGAGVDTLGFMTLAFAAGQFVASPVLGELADRRGRRPFILLGMIGVVLANLAFIWFSSGWLYIGVRFLQGAMGAGLMPAAMGVVADIFPENQRGQWIGILMGSYGVGFIFGPSLGGFLYDWLGYVAPFAVCAGLGLLGLLGTLWLIPETHRPDPQPLDEPATPRTALSRSLPRPLYIFLTLLTLDFMIIFAFAFIEPELSFFAYQTLHFSPSQFGILISGYGLALTAGQFGLARLSDRFGRKPLIAAGFVLNALFYLGLTGLRDFWLLLIISAVAGIGESLVVPALSAFYLDISDEQHRSGIMGLKESAAALGSMAGPLLVALLSGATGSQFIFGLAGVLALLSGGLAWLVLREQRGRLNPVTSPELPAKPFPLEK